MGERYLSVQSWHKCDACGGTGKAPPPGFREPCEVCDGDGELCTHLSRITPADLLTDPRVRALVETLRRVQGDYSIEEEEGRCVDEALAPFEEVTRG